jgi:transcription initiation factor IIE alpha subunit
MLNVKNRNVETKIEIIESSELYRSIVKLLYEEGDLTFSDIVQKLKSKPIEVNLALSFLESKQIIKSYYKQETQRTTYYFSLEDNVRSIISKKYNLNQ